MRAIDALSVPASDAWIAQRVVKLLTHYFVGEAAGAALEGVAADWIRTLGGLPEWAVEAACLWWIGPKNKHRYRKPLPGDIRERAESFMGPIKIGRTNLRLYAKHGDNPPSFVARQVGM